ncbi:YcgN family cysteine cluster protein [Glaciecola sp. KUL10]|uniref:YcgN family cysteine cluster protein n=1 Tax=Glaciecola sp. (strain KUL10) TaxID=2161813 RepID=UPI000D980D6B|nr:YcgN family cysteine cluster protein [Glaciecola sp. KUL10]GBL03436.1 hypothetical protein KUL10_07240 [Glaciecola sp. KUL10]
MSKSLYSKDLIKSQYWLDTPLADMSKEQWESICDGCAKCCLHKFIDDQSVNEEDDFAPTDVLREGEEILFTNIACHLLHTKTCACTSYEKRSTLVPDCVTLTKENLESIFYMPKSCSYRRLHEGRGLASWHPLLNKGKKAKMHESRISVRGRTVNEHDILYDEFEDYVVTWPENDID